MFGRALVPGWRPFVNKVYTPPNRLKCQPSPAPRPNPRMIRLRAAELLRLAVPESNITVMAGRRKDNNLNRQMSKLSLFLGNGCCRKKALLSYSFSKEIVHVPETE